MAKRKKKVKPTFKIYCTYFPDDTYYIGFSTKMGPAYEKYFGSNKAILEMVKGNPDHGLIKETIAEYDKRSYARIAEFLLQWSNRHDDRCLNDMINVRLRMSYLKDFIEPEWSPSTYQELLTSL